MLDAIALGELLIDFATVDTDRDGYPTLAAHPGGAPGNFLAALHAYGCSGAMLGKVGADTFGDLLCATLAQAGIRTEGIVRDPSVFTTLAFVTFGPGGERAFSFARKPGADTQLRFDELDLSLLDEARLFHFGSLSLTQSRCAPPRSRPPPTPPRTASFSQLRPEPPPAAVAGCRSGENADSLGPAAGRYRQDQR
ncbi:MAG: PfkB family carbohydrate kinase [Oscillospiraceae bacterium]